MSDFYDATEWARSHDDLIREHKTLEHEPEVESSPVLAVVCMGVGVFLLWLVLS